MPTVTVCDVHSVTVCTQCYSVCDSVCTQCYSCVWQCVHSVTVCVTVCVHSVTVCVTVCVHSVTVCVTVWQCVHSVTACVTVWQCVWRVNVDSGCRWRVHRLRSDALVSRSWAAGRWHSIWSACRHVGDWMRLRRADDWAAALAWPLGRRPALSHPQNARYFLLITDCDFQCLVLGSVDGGAIGDVTANVCLMYDVFVKLIH